MKTISIISAALIAGLMLPVHAAFIDNGNYTTDDISGLDWLDLSISDAQSFSNAESLNPGWRHASESEVDVLFANLFDEYYDTNSTYHYSDSAYGGYVDQSADVEAFQNLFGTTYSNYGYQYTYGWFSDDTDTLRLAGTWLSSDERSVVLSADYIPDYEFYRDSGHHSVGVYLVRDSHHTTVPEPTSLLLLALGLFTVLAVSKSRLSPRRV